VALSILLLLLLPQAAPDREALFQQVADLVRTEGLPTAPALGFALRVGDEERAWAWGFADVDNSRTATPDTRFRLGSVSKCLTGVAVALLWQRGALDLDAPVQKYVPDFPVKEEGVITPRLLAAHLSGVPHYGPGDRFEPGTYHKVIDGLRIFAAHPLRQAPGAQYVYSTYGFNLLGACAEAAAKQEFRAFLQQEMFVKLGMTDTMAEHPGDDLGTVASLYETVFGKQIEVVRDDIAYKWPGGGFIATPRDLVRFARVLEAKSPLLEPRALEFLRTAQQTAEGKSVGYSCGFRVGRDAAGRVSLSHGGAQTGAKAFLLSYPDQRIAVAILVNHQASSIGDGQLAERAAALLLAAVKPQ
jgi:CubicO group peptidase (beta-lactamase class C family)